MPWLIALVGFVAFTLTLQLKRPPIRPSTVAIIAVAWLFVVCFGWAAWTRLRAPESAAKEDVSGVHIQLLKGFEGDVLYIGSDDTHAYFRSGNVFWSYRKVPRCMTNLPRTFAINAGEPYVARLENLPTTSTECAESRAGASR
jgi:hypothetical protein